MNCLQTQQRANPAQESAIHHGQGPMLVLAGPGSGKTWTVTQRIGCLIREHHVPPRQILVITFTKAAAQEMKERFERAPDSGEPVSFFTFHAFFLHILKQSGYQADISILSEQEKKKVVTGIVGRHRHEGTSDSDVAVLFLMELSRMRNSGQSLAEFEPARCGKALFEEIYAQYERYKEETGKYDFEDLQRRCFWLLYKNREIRRGWQERFRFVLVDECQDMNELQYRIVRMLTQEHHNLFMVGDDDQSVYGFRGARPDRMRRMLTDYPGCREVLLTQNYRCAASIVKAAGKVIGQNQNRLGKSITAGRENAGTVTLQGFATAALEREALTEQLRRQARRQPFWQCAVIFRTNREMSWFAAGLAQAGIAFQMKEQGKSIFREAAAQDILAYLRFASGECGRGLFYRLMNRPYRGIPRELVREQRVDVQALAGRCRAAGESRFLCENLDRLAKDLERLKHLAPFAAVQYVCKGMGYEAYLRQKEPKEESRALLGEILESARETAELGEWLNLIERYEAQLEQRESGARTPQSALSLMTMHAAKGLEFDCVYLPHLNEGIMPHAKSVSEEMLEEECRMLYVGMTRAKEELHLSCVTGTKEKPEQMSRFLRALAADYGAGASSTSSSNSALSRNSSNASATFSYSSSSSIN